MNTNRRTGVIIAASALLLGFFLPWFKTSFFTIPSPHNMMMGLGAYALDGAQILLYPIPFCAAMLIFNEYSDSAPFRGIEKLLKILPLICWGLFTIGVKHRLSSSLGDEVGQLAMRGLMEVAQFGFYSTAIGVIWLFLLFFTPSKRPMRYASGYEAGPAPATMVAPPVVPVSPPKPQGPTVSYQLGKGMGYLLRLIGYYWRISLAVVALLLSAYAGYAMFIRANPEKDGKILAQQYCDCQQINLAAQIRIKKTFLNKKASIGMQAALLDSLARLQEQYEICQQGVKEAVNHKLGEYVSSPENAFELQRSIEAHRALWTSLDSIKLRYVDKQLADRGYNTASDDDDDEPQLLTIGNALLEPVKTFELYSDIVTKGAISGTASLELAGWLFDSPRPYPSYPELASNVSGSIRFAIRVSAKGKIVEAVKTFSTVSPAQEKDCKEALLESRLTRTDSGSGGAVGTVEFRFTINKQSVATVDDAPPANPTTYQEAPSETVGKASNESEAVPNEVVEEKVYTYVEQMPELPSGGGNAAVVSAIQNGIKYPDSAVQNKVQGRIFTVFTVSANGEVADARIVKGLGYGLDEEVQRVVESLRFNPGKQNGQAVNVSLTLPITLILK